MHLFVTCIHAFQSYFRFLDDFDSASFYSWMHKTLRKHTSLFPSSTLQERNMINQSLCRGFFLAIQWDSQISIFVCASLLPLLLYSLFSLSVPVISHSSGPVQTLNKHCHQNAREKRERTSHRISRQLMLPNSYRLQERERDLEWQRCIVRLNYTVTIMPSHSFPPLVPISSATISCLGKIPEILLSLVKTNDTNIFFSFDHNIKDSRFYFLLGLRIIFHASFFSNPV